MRKKIPGKRIPQAHQQPPQINRLRFKAYSKYDFVPGEKVIGFEDFITGTIGDFPAGWNTNAAGEIVTIDGKAGRWLKITKPGEFVPELTENYPDDFTLEFDLLHGIPTRGASITICLAELSNLVSATGLAICQQSAKC